MIGRPVRLHQTKWRGFIVDYLGEGLYVVAIRYFRWVDRPFTPSLMDRFGRIIEVVVHINEMEAK